jgi:hypothetical protein
MACTSKQSLGGLLLCFCENWKAAVWQLWNGTDPHKTYQTHLVPSFGTMWSLWKLAHLAQSGCRVQIYLMDHGCRKLPYFKPTHTHRHTHTCTHAHTHTFTHTHTHTHTVRSHTSSVYTIQTSSTILDTTVLQQNETEAYALEHNWIGASLVVCHFPAQLQQSAIDVAPVIDVMSPSKPPSSLL